MENGESNWVVYGNLILSYREFPTIRPSIADSIFLWLDTVNVIRGKNLKFKQKNSWHSIFACSPSNIGFWPIIETWKFETDAFYRLSLLAVQKLQVMFVSFFTPCLVYIALALSLPVSQQLLFFVRSMIHLVHIGPIARFIFLRLVLLFIDMEISLLIPYCSSFSVTNKSFS